ncbi:MAG TPA: hypothetical protein VEA69_13990 [Tepidisphaeraceae bacterium]|nr:hypothetical protein [Tepidisphaeraceae bacterium]
MSVPAPAPSRRTAPHPTLWRAALYRVVFEHDTRAGKAFAFSSAGGGAGR